MTRYKICRLISADLFTSENIFYPSQIQKLVGEHYNAYHLKA